MGRNALTIEEKEAKGTVNTTRERQKNEPRYPYGVQLVSVQTDDDGTVIELTVPVAPDEFGDKARAVWDRNCMQLATMGLFPNSAYEYLITYCRLFEINEKAFDSMGGHQTMVSPANGAEIISPFYRVYTDTWERMMKIGEKFGFTPADKAKLSSKAIDDKTKRKDKNKQKSIGVSG